MAKEKKVVVTEQTENVPQQQEVTAPAPVEQKTSDSEPAKVETPAKKQKKASNPKKDKPAAPAKDKSEKPTEEKPAESADKSNGKKKVTLKLKDKKKNRPSEPVVESAESADKPSEPVVESARDKMFPAEFTVHGIKFTRLELKADKVRDSVSKKDIDSYINAIADARDNEPDNCQLCLAFQWSEDMLAPTGIKGKGDSLYKKSTGITPPPKFPYDLDICIMTAFLSVRVEKMTTYSLYTEFPGTVEFSVFHKRTREGWFNCFDAPCEVYLADFSGFDFSSGMFVDLYKDNGNK